MVIPSYNNEQWYEKNLDSVFSQDYSNYRVIYVDDCSADGTGCLVEKYLKENGLEQRCTLIKNKQRVGSLANLYRAIHQCRADEIVVDLDGDDWFAHDQVLAYLNQVYADEDVWVTYGQFSFYPCGSMGWCEQVPQEIIQRNAFREYPWVTTALRTFYAGLFHRIKVEDLYYEGNFFQMAGDLAFMFPILEMAGSHSRFIPEVLYIYNVVTPINDIKRDPQLQQRLGFDIRKRAKYSPIEKVAYIIPGQWGDIFAFDNPIFNRDGCLEPIRQLKQRCEREGIKLQQAYSLDSLDSFDSLLMFEVPIRQPYSSISLSELERIEEEKLVLFLWEPPSVAPENYIRDHHRNFSRIYTWHDDLVDDETYFKLYYPVLKPMTSDLVEFNSKKLATMIACNKHSATPNELYSERAKLIHFYESNHRDDFDLYGRWWPSSIGVYRGPVERKEQVLKQYKFSFAYENIWAVPGYITEKIFDCFQAGCVPVYWGAPNVTDYIPQNCFIAREDFDTDEELYQYLVSMEEEQYNGYLENIRQFIESDQAQRFSPAHFVETVIADILKG